MANYTTLLKILGAKENHPIAKQRADFDLSQNETPLYAQDMPSHAKAITDAEKLFSELQFALLIDTPLCSK